MKYKQVRNPDGSYTYRGCSIKKGRWDGRRSKKTIWSYTDARTGLWRTAPTLKQCKAIIDRFNDFYTERDKHEQGKGKSSK